MDTRDFALGAPGSASITNISAYVVPVKPANPIDTFLRSRASLIRLGGAKALTESPDLGRLLLLGVVSAFENFCRGILAGCISLCPISQAKSSEKNLNFGGALWHGPSGNFNRSAFEHKSFTDEKEIRSIFKEYINFELNNAVYSDLLSEIDKIMQVRHAIVHADGYLPGRNAVKLEISRSSLELRVSVDLTRLQECTLVLSNFVELLNREVFAEICRRWAVSWRQRADWQPHMEDKTLEKIWGLFVATSYNASLKNRKKWGRKALKRELERVYSL